MILNFGNAVRFGRISRPQNQASIFRPGGFGFPIYRAWRGEDVFETLNAIKCQTPNCMMSIEDSGHKGWAYLVVVKQILLGGFVRHSYSKTTVANDIRIEYGTLVASTSSISHFLSA